MLIITIQIIAILAMLTFIFIGIWGFIFLIKTFNQIRYKNYLMEKLIENTSSLSSCHENREYSKEDLEAKNVLKPSENKILDNNIKKEDRKSVV